MSVDLTVSYTDMETNEELCFLHAVKRALEEQHQISSSVKNCRTDDDYIGTSCDVCKELREEEEREEWENEDDEEVDKFTEEDAINRNLDSERDALEGR